ncbi:MAG: glutamate synthase, partial [Bacillota bacterium]|nr:glutamate synthase [Bacillota bacterium]
MRLTQKQGLASYMMTQTWNPSLFKDFHRQEHDACGIVASLEKHKIPTRKNIFDCIDALITMNHRAGFINGEGDGVGIHIDIPRELWKAKLQKKGLDSSLAENDGFAVGHIFINRKSSVDLIKNELKSTLQRNGFVLLYENTEATNPSSLGPIAMQENPVFWQIACLSKETG